MSYITNIAHINLTVPRGTLETAAAFYADTLGLTRVPVPSAQTQELAWYVPSPYRYSSIDESRRFNIGESGQQVHIAFPAHEQELADKTARRHPCFKLASQEAMQQLQARIWAHYKKGGEGAPLQADKPGDVNSGERGLGHVSRPSADLHVLGRCPREGISHTVLRARLCGEQAGVQLVTNEANHRCIIVNCEAVSIQYLPKTPAS
jgi:catechol 2,3-dioxygenase-like lactoylglutathione lyase family enzyme